MTISKSFIGLLVVLPFLLGGGSPTGEIETDGFKATNTTTKEVHIESKEVPETLFIEEKPEVKPEPKAEVKTKEEPKPKPESNGKVFSMEATAYTAYCTGCSGVTRTGQDLRKNPNQKVIAVDPSVIPLGSIVHVEGYGEALAGDIGGAIKGNKIDVFIPSESEANRWGRQYNVKVTIIKLPE
jgi:3D (Asp-Asp-Asp) domain-containing protein